MNIMCIFTERVSAFRCKRCGRRFRRKSSLTKHLRFQCGGLTTTTTSSTTASPKHVSSKKPNTNIFHHHSDLFQYKMSMSLSYPCTLCGRRYMSKGSLNRHLTYECGVGKQFYCEVCSKSYNRHDSLIAHQKSKDHYNRKMSP